jgi:hypothetical protein
MTWKRLDGALLVSDPDVVAAELQGPRVIARRVAVDRDVVVLVAVRRVVVAAGKLVVPSCYSVRYV